MNRPTNVAKPKTSEVDVLKKWKPRWAWLSEFLLRREGSNLRPSGYEPDELPLLYFAILSLKYFFISYEPDPETSGLFYFAILRGCNLCWYNFAAKFI